MIRPIDQRSLTQLWPRTHSHSPQGSNGSLTRRRMLGLVAGVPIALDANSARAQGLSGTIRIGYEASNEAAVPFIEETAAAVEAANPDARIELEPSTSANFLIQLVLQLTTGQAPDVILVGGPVLAELAAAGHIVPLDDYLAGWDAWGQYPDAFKPLLTYNGSIWSVPHSFDTHFVYYRRDIFAQAGLPADWQPASPDDMLDAALTIKNSVPDVIPYALYAGANGGVDTVGRGFLPLVYAHGGEFRDENGLWIIDSCAIRAALEHYERAYQIDETVPQDVMTGVSPVKSMRQAMLDGELGIVHDGSWNYGTWLKEDATATRDQIGYTLFPTADGSTRFAVGGSGFAWYINSKAEFPDLAWAYIEAFNSVETQVAINVADPHIPGRQDAAAAPAFQEDPFLRAMVGTASSLIVESPDPTFRELITVVQNGTGIVASGEATPEEAVERYASELARILGEENVVRQPCP